MLGDQYPAFNVNRFDLEAGYLPAAPAVDEDGDGRFLDEIPMAEEGDPSLFTDDGPPSYADGRERESNVYYSATMGHQDNILANRFMEEDARFSDAWFIFDGDTLGLAQTSPGAMLASVIEHQIPVFTDDRSPRYADGQARARDAFYYATLDHRDNLLVNRWSRVAK